MCRKNAKFVNRLFAEYLLAKVLVSVFFIALFQFKAFPQNDNSTPKLLARVDFLNTLDYVQEEIIGKIYLPNQNVDDEEKPEIYFRLCTNEALEPALVKSTINLPEVFKALFSLKYPAKKLFVLKENSCPTKYQELTTTEIWIVSRNQKVPDFDEKYELSKIEIEEIQVPISIKYRYLIDYEIYGGSIYYLQDAKKLAEILKKDSSKKAVIIGIYKTQPNQLNNRFEKISKILKKEKIESSRLFIQGFKEKKYLYFDNQPRKNTFPVFYTVKINN